MKKSFITSGPGRFLPGGPRHLSLKSVVVHSEAKKKKLNYIDCQSSKHARTDT